VETQRISKTAQIMRSRRRSIGTYAIDEFDDLYISHRFDKWLKALNSLLQQRTPLERSRRQETPGSSDAFSAPKNVADQKAGLADALDRTCAQTLRS